MDIYQVSYREPATLWHAGMPGAQKLKSSSDSKECARLLSTNVLHWMHPSFDAISYKPHSRSKKYKNLPGQVFGLYQDLLPGKYAETVGKSPCKKAWQDC